MPVIDVVVMDGDEAAIVGGILSFVQIHCDKDGCSQNCPEWLNFMYAIKPTKKEKKT